MPILEHTGVESPLDRFDGRETHDCGHDHTGQDQTRYSVASGLDDHLKFERYRLQTFNTWPYGQNVNKDDLARSGFQYIGDGTNDRVQCVFCKIILHSWDWDDDIEEEHEKHAPRCPFVTDRSHVDNFPLPFRRLVSNNRHHQGPLHAEYESREIRFASFDDNWPSSKRQTPGELANAGFFYLVIQPEEYREFVNQLDHYLESLPGTTQEKRQRGSNNSITEQQAANNEIIPSQISDRYTCKVCIDHPVEIIFYPCKHVCCCLQCSEIMFKSNPNASCPMCRAKITGKLKLFFP